MIHDASAHGHTNIHNMIKLWLGNIFLNYATFKVLHCIKDWIEDCIVTAFVSLQYRTVAVRDLHLRQGSCCAVVALGDSHRGKLVGVACLAAVIPPVYVVAVRREAKVNVSYIKSCPPCCGHAQLTPRSLCSSLWPHPHICT